MLVDDDFLTEIGRVAVLQSEIEASMGALVGSLTGADPHSLASPDVPSGKDRAVSSGCG
jgi:hypothetical protein